MEPALGLWPCGYISLRDFAARKWIALRLRVAHTPPSRTGRRTGLVDRTARKWIALRLRVAHTPPPHRPRHRRALPLNHAQLYSHRLTPACRPYGRNTMTAGRFILILGLFVVTAPVTRAAEEDRLAEFFTAYLDEEFRARPLAATQLGDHRYDHLLDDVSPKARAA